MEYAARRRRALVEMARRRRSSYRRPIGGISLPDRLGARIKDMVVVTADGCERLNQAPRELCRWVEMSRTIQKTVGRWTG